MSENDLKNIRESAQNHRIEPRPEAWDKLNSKLKAKKTKVKMISYRNISIAAILISVLSVTIVMTMFLGDHDPDVFASNEQYRPIVLEELEDSTDDPFYDVTNINQLRTAYKTVDLNFAF